MSLYLPQISQIKTQISQFEELQICAICEQNQRYQRENIITQIFSVTENEISYLIRSAIFKTDSSLGPGLLESTYCAILNHELEKLGLKVRTQVALPVIHGNIKLNVGYRIDLLVEEKVIIEVKSVEALAPVHHKQVLTYLRLSGLKLGLLVNFNTDDISKSIFRKVNGL